MKPSESEQIFHPWQSLQRRDLDGGRAKHHIVPQASNPRHVVRHHPGRKRKLLPLCIQWSGTAWSRDFGPCGRLAHPSWAAHTNLSKIWGSFWYIGGLDFQVPVFPTDHPAAEGFEALLPWAKVLYSGMSSQWESICPIRGSCGNGEFLLSLEVENVDSEKLAVS